MEEDERREVAASMACSFEVNEVRTSVIFSLFKINVDLVLFPM